MTVEPKIFSNFQTRARRIISTIASIRGENMLRYLSLDIICISNLTVFLEPRSRTTVRFLEQIMSADKYPRIFSHQLEAIVCIFLWRNKRCYSPIFESPSFFITPTKWSKREQLRRKKTETVVYRTETTEFYLVLFKNRASQCGW